MNAEGYNDPTADNAVGKITKQEREIRTMAALENHIRFVARLAGYEVSKLEFRRKR